MTEKKQPKKAAVKKAPAKKAAQTKHKAKRSATKTTEKLLRVSPVVGPDSPLTPEQELFITEYLRDWNGTAAYIRMHPGMAPNVASSSASRALRIVKVRERIEAERARMAAAQSMTRDELMADLVAIVRADPAELSQMRRVCCERCWGEQATGTWTEPNPECLQCDGEGVERPWFADTRKLPPSVRALFSGVKVTTQGLQVLMESKDAARDKLAKILGAYEQDNAQKTDPLRQLLAAIGTRSALPVVGKPGDSDE